MAAKAIKTLEIHYPMLQVLIIVYAPNLYCSENGSLRKTLNDIYLATLQKLPVQNEFPRKTSWRPTQLLW